MFSSQQVNMEHGFPSCSRGRSLGFISVELPRRHDFAGWLGGRFGPRRQRPSRAESHRTGAGHAGKYAGRHDHLRNGPVAAAHACARRPFAAAAAPATASTIVPRKSRHPKGTSCGARWRYGELDRATHQNAGMLRPGHALAGLDARAGRRPVRRRRLAAPGLVALRALDDAGQGAALRGDSAGRRRSPVDLII